MVSRIIAGTIAALLASAFSQACIAPPERATTGHREIISEAQWIAVMRTGSLAGRGESIRADLQLVECLKGDCPEQWRVDNFFSLDFAESEIDEWSYYAHRASVFWTGVQYDLGSDCDLSAALSPNRLHLVFGPEHYGLGFSVIATPDDAWLDFVRQELAGQSPPFPIEVLGETYFEALEGAFIGTLRWDGRTVIVSHEELIPLNQDISSEIDGFLTARHQFEVDPECASHWWNHDVPTLQESRWIYFVEFIPENNPIESAAFTCSGQLEPFATSLTQRGALSFPIRNDQVLFGNNAPFAIGGEQPDRMPVAEIRDLISN